MFAAALDVENRVYAASVEPNLSQQRGLAVNSERFGNLPYWEQERVREVLLGPPDEWDDEARACLADVLEQRARALREAGFRP